jgi:predicted aldo/keto reductase-like oxidoreductase
MQYREMGKTGDKVSILGYGCMRLKEGDGHFDEKQAARLVRSAIDRGVNYVDTAYLYLGNETLVGNILSDGYRDKVLLATKLPPVQVTAQKDMEKLLNTQLERLRTDRIDYYLMHNIMSVEGWERLKQLGVLEFLEKAKAAGKIRRVAFSSHGTKEQFKKIVDDYPWDMAQIQYNYLDEQNQAGREGLRYAAGKGLGIVVMEPLRGGYLVNKLPDEVKTLFDSAPVKRSAAEWGLRWVWNHPEVSLLLSGMNGAPQVEENLRIAGDMTPGSLTDAELRMFADVKAAIASKVKVPCTGCAYCMPCPAGVDIPGCFSIYNDKFIHKGLNRETSYLIRTSGFDGGTRSYASLCKNCGACEKKCPQSIPIRRHLAEVTGEFEKFYFKPAVGMVQGYLKLRAKRGKKKPEQNNTIVG